MAICKCERSGRDREEHAMSEVTTEQLQELLNDITRRLDNGSSFIASDPQMLDIQKLAKAELSRRAAVPINRQELIEGLKGVVERINRGGEHEFSSRIIGKAITALSAPSQPIIELSGIAEALAESDGFWHACSGCHELNEGHDTGPYSQVFKCALGIGCGECGGLGAVWDTSDYTKMYQHLSEGEPSQPNAADKPVADLSRFVGALDAAIEKFSEDIKSWLGRDQQCLSQLQQLKQICEGVQTPEPQKAGCNECGGNCGINCECLAQLTDK